jgi:hypothetical protein
MKQLRIFKAPSVEPRGLSADVFNALYERIRAANTAPPAPTLRDLQEAIRRHGRSRVEVR